MTSIDVGTAVRHRTRPQTMMGRVRKVLGPRALCVWVRRRLPSYVRLENLEPITDAELAAFWRQQEDLYERAWQEIETDQELAGAIARPDPLPDEHRAFLLGALPEDGPAERIRADAGVGVPVEMSDSDE